MLKESQIVNVKSPQHLFPYFPKTFRWTFNVIIIFFYVAEKANTTFSGKDSVAQRKKMSQPNNRPEIKLAEYVFLSTHILIQHSQIRQVVSMCAKFGRPV